MLVVQQLARIKNENFYIYEALQKIIGSLNRAFLQVGIDPMPGSQALSAEALPAPKPPAHIMVTAVTAFAFVELTRDVTHNDLTLFFVEMSDTSDFRQVTRYAIGPATQAVLPIPAGTVTFWRAAAKWPMSPLSSYTVLSP